MSAFMKAVINADAEMEAEVHVITNQKKRLINSLFFYSFFLVLKPKGRYKGQKLRKLVTMNIADKASNIIASVPEITLVNQSTTTTTATSILITLSIVPMFFFISDNLN